MKNRLKIVAIAICLFCGYTTIWAQLPTQTIRGEVLDVDSKTPLIGVNVLLKDTGPIMGGVTDAKGNFVIRNVPIGKYDIIVSYVGYEGRVIPNVSVTSGKEVILSIKIAESIMQLEGVVITANEHLGEPINEFATLSSMSFSMEESSKYAGTFNDPSRMVATTAGVFGGGGSDDVDNEIIIRGNSPRGLLWRIEGIEVPSPNHFTDQGASSGSVSILSSNSMSTSDFFTGAFPAEYGNALSGVFDMKLREGNNEKHEYALRVGVIGVDASMEGPFKKGGDDSYLLNYRYSTLSLLNDIGVELVEDAIPIFQDLTFKVSMPTEKFGDFSIFGVGGLSKETEVIEGILEDGSYGDLLTEFVSSDLGIVGINHDYALSNKTMLSSILSFSANQITFSRDVAISQDQKIRVNNENFIDYSGRFSLTLNHKFNAQHLLRSGFIYSNLNYDLLSENFNGQQLSPEVDNDGSTSVFQAYSTWKYRISKKWILNTGLHFTQFMLNDRIAVEPRVQAKWFANDKNSFSAGFGMHSRRESLAVYLAERPLTNGGPPVFINKDLDFTKSIHYVLGYNRFISDNLTFKAEAYYQDLYNVPVIDSSYFSAINLVQGFTSSPLINEGTGANYGVELTLQSFFNQNYYFNVNVSLFQSKYVGGNDIERNTLYNSNYLTNILGGYDFNIAKNKSLNVNLRAVYAGGQRFIPIDETTSIQAGRTIYMIDQAFENRLEDYFRMDFQASYAIDYPKYRLEFRMDIQNITDRANVRDISFTPELQRVTENRRGQLLPILSIQVKF